MLNIQTTPLRTTPSESATSKPTSGQAPLHGTDPAGFASLLRQSQGAHALPAPSPAPPARPDPVPAPRPVAAPAAPAEPASAPHAIAAAKAPGRDAQPEPSPNADTAEPPEGDQAGGTAAQLPTRLRGTGSAKPVVDAAAADGSQAQTLAASKAEPATSMHAPAGAPPVDPTLMQWLAGTPRTAEAGHASSAPEPRSAAGGGTRTAGSDTLAAQDASAAMPASAPRVEANGTDRGTPDKAAVDTTPATGDFAAALTSQGPIDKLPAREAAAGGASKDNTSIASLAASAAAWAPSAAGAAAAAAPVVVTLPTPVGAPEFAQALGVQMSVLAKGGVQHAELHLNPADMGPVSVQIVMDGTQARVDFGADVAATRQAIEAGLPALASALRDAGFTLTGGGVSQHSRGRGEGGVSAANLRTRRTGAVDVDDAPIGVRREVRTTVKVGGLDLYA